MARYALRAPFDGVYFSAQMDIKVGTWVAENERIGTVSSPDQWQVVTYLSEAELNRVELGDRARFYSDAQNRTVLPLEVVRIDRDATRTLPEGILASTRGGDILVRDSSQGQFIPERAIYRVTLALVGDTLPDDVVIQRGRVVMFGQPRNYIGEFMQTAAALFVREAGF